MIIHTHPEIIKTRINKTFKIIAFSDVHFGAESCAEHRFERDVIEKHAGDPNAYFLCIGDAYDAITPRDMRFRITEVAQKFNASDSVIDAVIKDFVRLWRKHKIPPERILGFATGNHEDEALKRYGTDMTERTCYELKTKNLGYSFYLRLLTLDGTHRAPLVIFGSHGFGGSTRTDGADITKYVRHCFRHPGAQIYLYGHSHQKWSKRVAVVKPDFSRKIQHDDSIIVGACGSYLKTYGHGPTPTYAERWGVNPVELGNLVIEVTPRCSDKHDEFGERKTHYFLDLRVLE